MHLESVREPAGVFNSKSIPGIDLRFFDLHMVN
jgi:hypothetical protein